MLRATIFICLNVNEQTHDRTSFRLFISTYLFIYLDLYFIDIRLMDLRLKRAS